MTISDLSPWFTVPAALLLLAWWVLARTRFGLIMRVTQFDRETATAFLRWAMTLAR